MGRSVDVFRFAAIEALRDDGEVFAGDVSAGGRDRRAYTLRVPVRLVAAITPFNHPLNQVAHKLAPAIAAGAPIVLKPSEKTPLSALRLAQIMSDAGLPAGAAQVVCGDPAAVLDAFLAHEAVELICFTGGAGRPARARASVRVAGPTGGRRQGAQIQTIRKVDHFEDLAAEEDDLCGSGTMRLVLTQVEGLLDRRHRERPGEAAGAWC